MNCYGNPFPSIMALNYLALQAEKRFNSLPKEERNRILQEKEDREKKRIIDFHIQAGICPECKSKLKRGKKDKHNNYMRTWTCPKCDSIFYH